MNTDGLEWVTTELWICKDEGVSKTFRFTKIKRSAINA